MFTPEKENQFHNIIDSFDFYVVAHLLGWTGKMLIIRDVKVVWFCSVLFELIELSLNHHLPNFCECWWDSVLMDILIFNGGGIYIGLLICRVFKMRRYTWDTLQETRETHFGDGTPETTTSLRKLFSSSRTFYCLVWYIFFINMVDLSNFVLKFILYMPADHIIL